MTRVAIVAEGANQHPEWFNVHRTATVDLTAHDCGGISHRDFALAQRMDAVAGSSGASEALEASEASAAEALSRSIV